MSAFNTGHWMGGRAGDDALRLQAARALRRARATWRFRWVGLSVAYLVALSGWAIVFALPDRYAAEARIFVDTRTFRPAIQGLTVERAASAQLNFVRESMLQGLPLEQLATETGILPSTVGDEFQKARLLDRFRERITLSLFNPDDDPTLQTGTTDVIYMFRYLDDDRQRALRVIELLFAKFTDRALAGKHEGTQKLQRFLSTEVKDYEQQLRVAEDRLTEFKKRHAGLMPDEGGGYLAKMRDELETSKRIQTNLSIALSRREELSRQLRGNLSVLSSGVGAQTGAGQPAAGSDTWSRLQAAQARLAELRLKYTEQHPDVLAAQAALSELRLRSASELKRLHDGGPNTALDLNTVGANPIFVNLRLQLNTQDVEIAALRRQQAEHDGTVAELSETLHVAPQIEAEWAQLTRDYGIVKAQYESLMASYHAADLGERAEDAGSVRIKTLVPPNVSPSPVWPDRKALLTSILLAAVATGAATAYYLQLLRPVIFTVAGLRTLTKMPVLGVIGEAFPRTRRVRNRRSLLKFSIAAVGLLVAWAAALEANLSGYRFVSGNSSHRAPFVTRE